MITISKCQLQDKHAGYIIDMIKSLKDLSILDLTGNNFTASKITEIQAAWGYRGLTL